MLKLAAAALTAAALLTAPTLAVAQNTTAPAATTAEKPAAKPKRAVSAGQQAMRDRQKQCGTQWKADKAAGKIEKGQTWPKYWSACNKRLKGA